MSSVPSDGLNPEADLNQSVGFVSAVFLLATVLCLTYLQHAQPLTPHKRTTTVTLIIIREG